MYSVLKIQNALYKGLMAKNNSKHIEEKTNKTNKSHHNKSYKKIAFIVVVFIIIILFINLKDNNKFLSYENTQIILNNENITDKMKNSPIIENGKIYMSMKDIESFIDKTIYQEPETGLIITASNKKISTLKMESENITINGSNKNIKDSVIEKDGEYYLAISELESVYNYEFNYTEKSNIVTMDSLNNELIKAYAKKNIKIKEETKVIENVKKGDWIIYIGEENDKAKIRTQNGNIGYVKKSSLNNFVTERENFIEDTSSVNNENALEYDITGKDISTFQKREEIINIILQQAIKNDKMYVKIIYTGESNSNFERFKIEVCPMLEECGIKVNI